MKEVSTDNNTSPFTYKEGDDWLNDTPSDFWRADQESLSERVSDMFFSENGRLNIGQTQENPFSKLYGFTTPPLQTKQEERVSHNLEESEIEQRMLNFFNNNFPKKIVNYITKEESPELEIQRTPTRPGIDLKLSSKPIKKVLPSGENLVDGVFMLSIDAESFDDESLSKLKSSTSNVKVKPFLSYKLLRDPVLSKYILDFASYIFPNDICISPLDRDNEDLEEVLNQ